MKWRGRRVRETDCFEVGAAGLRSVKIMMSSSRERNSACNFLTSPEASRPPTACIIDNCSSSSWKQRRYTRSLSGAPNGIPSGPCPMVTDRRMIVPKGLSMSHDWAEQITLTSLFLQRRKSDEREMCSDSIKTPNRLIDYPDRLSMLFFSGRHMNMNHDALLKLGMVKLRLRIRVPINVAILSM